MQRPAQRRLIVSHAGKEAYLPLARAVLSKMGYAIVTPEERGELPPSIAGLEPRLRIVDERRLEEIPDGPEGDIPVIVLTGRHGVTGADPRVLGAVRRPAGLHELYRLIQQALEDTPRSAPRVPTNLPARIRSQEREWRASVLSLSESGCLLRTPEPVSLGCELQLAIELPRVGVVETPAEAAYQLVPDIGLVFNGTAAASREAIVRFVEQALASA